MLQNSICVGLFFLNWQLNNKLYFKKSLAMFLNSSLAITVDDVNVIELDTVECMWCFIFFSQVPQSKGTLVQVGAPSAL